jgi:hypothetical protein
MTGQQEQATRFPKAHYETLEKLPRTDGEQSGEGAISEKFLSSRLSLSAMRDGEASLLAVGSA